jgi:putative hydrolase of the HAD superfamily
MPYSTLFFDLDETLYPARSGVWEAIARRIDLYMHVRLGIPTAEIPALREHLFKTYGTTLRGLCLTRHIDELDYLAFVHDIPLEDFLTPDPRVRAMLARYPQRKVVFTNADQHHARRVLAMLNLEDCFERIVDILDVSPYCKPMPEAFDLALKKANVPSAQESVFIDDTRSNLIAARRAGFFTIHVGSTTPNGSHAAITSLLDLPSVLDP